MKLVMLFPLISSFARPLPGSLKGMADVSQKINVFRGGVIYNNAASSLIWVENQVSLGTNEMVMGKACFDQWL
jgi:hypothetical protein